MDENGITKRLERINAIANKAKSVGLTPEEVAEQKLLREEFISDFRKNFRGILDNTKIKYPDGTTEELKRKKDI